MIVSISRPRTAEGLPADTGRIVARLARQVETALATLELSPSQYRALAFLSEDGASAAASALAGRMSVSKPTITALVDGLVQRGLVERHPSQADRRRVEHSLTAEGRRTLAQADQVVNARLTEVAAHLDDHDRRAAGEGLQQWGAALTRSRLAALGQPAERR